MTGAPIVALAGTGVPALARARRRTDEAGIARVLIVKADEQPRADVVADLRAEGHDVLEAASADRGVEAARDADPEIILLDPMLPDRSGYGVYAPGLGLPPESISFAASSTSISPLASWRSTSSRDGVPLSRSSPSLPRRASKRIRAVG